MPRSPADFGLFIGDGFGNTGRTNRSRSPRARSRQDLVAYFNCDPRLRWVYVTGVAACFGGCRSAGQIGCTAVRGIRLDFSALRGDPDPWTRVLRQVEDEAIRGGPAFPAGRGGRPLAAGPQPEPAGHRRPRPPGPRLRRLPLPAQRPLPRAHRPLHRRRPAGAALHRRQRPTRTRGGRHHL